MAREKRGRKPSEKEDRASKGPVPHILRDLIISLFLTALLTWFQNKLQASETGKWMTRATHDFIQMRLSQDIQEPDLKVAVLDISKFRATEAGSLEEGLEVTPRKELLQILAKVAQFKPSAIGVDIDLSSDVAMTPDDDDFFLGVRKLIRETGVPIVLGVGRMVAYPPELQLDAASPPLGASVLVPKDKPGMMLDSIRVSPPGEPAYETPSLARKLLESAKIARAEPGPVDAALLSAGILEASPTEQVAPDVSARLLAVDFSALDPLSNQAARRSFTTVPALEAFRDGFQGRIVLLGDVEEAKDVFVPYGYRKAPGVHLHACAIQTMASSPVYVVTALGNLVIDLTLTFFALSLVSGLRIYYWRRSKKVIEPAGLYTFLQWCAILSIILVGVTVNANRIMWISFYIVALVLIVGMKLEALLPFLERGARAFPAWWKARVIGTRGR